MARRADPTPGHQRLLGLAAVAGLAVATALAFGRVFAGRAPTLQLVAAALASVAIAALFERRGLLLATLASLAGLAFAITWIVLPQTAWYGLPSIRTLRAVGRSLEFVGQQARVRVAPTPPLPPLMLAAVTAVWTAAFSSHALAIRAGSPLLAVLPPIALVGFADTVLEDGARPIYAIVLLAAAIAVVFADGLRRVRQWGPVWSGSRTRRLGPSVRGSRPVALMVIAAAVLVPGLLPGFRSGPLVDLSTAGDEGAGLDPFISIHAQLDEQEVRDLFEVETSQAQYWRLYTLDVFDGEEWRSSDPDGSVGGESVSVPTVLPQAPAYSFPPDTETQPFTFRVLSDFDAALRRHTELEEEHLFPAAPGEKLSSRADESERDRLFRELRLEHVQIRELSGMMVRQLGGSGGAAAARGLAANLARRWDAHTSREEREAFPLFELLDPLREAALRKSLKAES